MSSPLKQARIESGKTLEEISNSLKIRKQYLIALEDEDYDVIPGKVYVQGYLRLYANYLGIAPDAGEEEGEKQVLLNVVLQQRLSRVKLSNHRWKRHIIIVSILLLIIIPIIYHLIL